MHACITTCRCAELTRLSLSWSGGGQVTRVHWCSVQGADFASRACFLPGPFSDSSRSLDHSSRVCGWQARSLLHHEARSSVQACCPFVDDAMLTTVTSVCPHLQGPSFSVRRLGLTLSQNSTCSSASVSKVGSHQSPSLYVCIYVLTLMLQATCISSSLTAAGLADPAQSPEHLSQRCGCTADRKRCS